MRESQSQSLNPEELEKNRIETIKNVQFVDFQRDFEDILFEFEQKIAGASPDRQQQYRKGLLTSLQEIFDKSKTDVQISIHDDPITRDTVLSLALRLQELIGRDRIIEDSNMMRRITHYMKGMIHQLELSKPEITQKIKPLLNTAILKNNLEKESAIILFRLLILKDKIKTHNSYSDEVLRSQKLFERFWAEIHTNQQLIRNYELALNLFFLRAKQDILSGSGNVEQSLVDPKTSVFIAEDLLHQISTINIEALQQDRIEKVEAFLSINHQKDLTAKDILSQALNPNRQINDVYNLGKIYEGDHAEEFKNVLFHLSALLLKRETPIPSLIDMTGRIFETLFKRNQAFPTQDEGAGRSTVLVPAGLREMGNMHPLLGANVNDVTNEIFSLFDGRFAILEGEIPKILEKVYTSDIASEKKQEVFELLLQYLTQRIENGMNAPIKQHGNKSATELIHILETTILSKTTDKDVWERTLDNLITTTERYIKQLLADLSPNNTIRVSARQLVELQVSQSAKTIILPTSPHHEAPSEEQQHNGERQVKQFNHLISEHVMNMPSLRSERKKHLQSISDYLWSILNNSITKSLPNMGYAERIADCIAHVTNSPGVYKKTLQEMMNIVSHQQMLIEQIEPDLMERFETLDPRSSNTTQDFKQCQIFVVHIIKETESPHESTDPLVQKLKQIGVAEDKIYISNDEKKLFVFYCLNCFRELKKVSQ